MAQKALLNESELLVQASAGNERAFTELFYHYHQHLGRFVFRLTQSTALAEEIVQDVFIKIWVGRASLTNIVDFERYIYVAVRNQTYTALKKRASEKIHTENLEKILKEESELDLLDNPSEAYRELIAEAVAKLPEQQRTAYTMSRHERLKYHEIAEQMGLSTVTVKKHIQLAVQSIRQTLASRTDLPVLLVLTSVILR